MKVVLFFYFLCISALGFSQTLSGVVISEGNIRIYKTLVININSSQKVWSNEVGEFSISAKIGDELRFVKESYERQSIIIKNDFFLTVKLTKIPAEIEEVKISNIRLTGNLNTDINLLKIKDSAEELRKAVGLPKVPEKPREKVPEVKNILIPLMFASLNINDLYKVLSGDAKRMKRLYQYEDLQDDIKWARSKIENRYFTEAGIPEDKINDFILFSFRDSSVAIYVKSRNTTGLITALEKNIPLFLEKIGKK